MPAVRAFSVLYDLVGRNGQDESTQGDTLAKEAIVQTVQELSRDFKLPWQIIGRNGLTTLAVSATAGWESITPTQTDIQHISRIYYLLNNVVFDLERIESEREWLEKTNNYSTGNPVFYRDFEFGETDTNRQIIVWPGASSSFITLATNLKMEYYAVLANPSADGDIIRIPQEHETLIINGGTFHMAEKQGDSILMSIYSALYERDRQKLSAALTYMRYDEDVLVEPAEPYGFPQGLRGKGFSGRTDYGLR